MFKKTLIALSILMFSFLLLACDPGEGGTDVNETMFTEIFAEIAPPATANANLTLTSSSTLYPAASISWRSNNQKVITNQGELRKPDQATTVEMVAVVNIAGTIRTNRFPVLVSPVDTKIFDLNAYRSDYGYASLVISNRANNQGVPVNTVIEVATPIEFLDALANKNNKIIKITADLNLGFYHVERELIALGKTDEEISSYTDGSFYRMNANVPMLHPRLKEEGVGQLIIQDRAGLMIYSEYGAKISHLTSLIKTSSDVVIRNLHFADIWEWDDDQAGNYDDNDWDYFTIETSNGVWLDHLKFEQAYDGLIDVKGGTSNITFSYFDMEFVANDFIEEQIDWLEENYMSDPTKSPANSRYVKLRKEFNLTPEQIVRFSSAQKKGFNLGNTTMGLGFDTITITIHHSRFINLADRLPRLRQGDTHVYNVLLDNSELELARQIIAGTGTSLPSQAIVPTEEGAVLFENNKLIDVAEPIKTHQDNIMDPEYTGRYKVVNSILIKGIEFYKGDSYEGQAGGNQYTPWRQTNTNMPRIPYFLRNYQEIPYRYADTQGDGADYNYMVEPEMLGRVLKDNYVGPGVIPDFNWLEIRRIFSAPISPTAVRGHMIDPDSISIEDDLVELGGTFVPASPQVRNFYLGGPGYQQNTDYTLVIDQSTLNTDAEGMYEVTYTFTNLHNDWDTLVVKQRVLVYDPEGPNEIFEYTLSNEFDAIIDINYSVYTNTGTLFYALSDDPDLTLDEVEQLAGLLSVDITAVNGSIKNIPTERMKYVYMYTIRDGQTSSLIRAEIASETIVYITNITQLNEMITAFDSGGKYYILMNDIDLSTGRLDSLSTANVFRGIFDGNGHTLYNHKATLLRGGLFMTINGGMIKNLTLDDFEFTVDSIFTESSEQPGIFIEAKPSDDAGLLATYVYGYARFETLQCKTAF